MRLKYNIKILLVIVPGIAVLLLVFSKVWVSIVRTHLRQFDESVLSQAALNATQEAFTEKATYQASEYRTKRLHNEAQNQYELERIQLKMKMLPRYAALRFYGVIGIFSVAGVTLIILASGYARAKIMQSSMCVARIGPHSEIPVHYNDLQNFYPIAVNLSLAEIQTSTSASHENAYQISRQMIEDITNYTRAIAGKRGLLSNSSLSREFKQSFPTTSPVPYTFAELLQKNIVTPGEPLVLGYDRQGQMQHRALPDLKSLAIAGWQGSGKTLSMAYIVASCVLAYKVQAYIIDPHKNHNESLSSRIQPLEDTGYVTIVNPFDTAALLDELNKTLDRRLDGQESNEPGILLVIDELARLANMECFDQLVAFLERCTEETRKANITFIGGSHKWTARHFHGRADIRGCMNSILLHKTKPSQADLLLEDAHDKHLVKQLHHPGDAVLVTDFQTSTIVSVPLCTREDMKTVADLMTTPGEDIRGSATPPRLKLLSA